MVWHDCKTDPPKDEGEYLLIYTYYNTKDWDRARYNGEIWLDEDTCIPYGITGWRYSDCIPYKWAEVDLSEVE